MLTIFEIQQKITPLADKYSLESVQIFGSYASGKQKEESDVDFLVKFKKEIPSIFDVAGLQYEMEQALLLPVDVVTLPLISRKLNIGSTKFLYGE